MQFISIQNSDIPALGFGTWQLKGSECAAAVQKALETGYRHIDTAQVYENEAEVGDGIEAHGIGREDFFLTTKVWRNHFAEGDVLESVNESLRKLRTDYVDLLLIHWPFPETPVKQMVEALMEVKKAGKARHIGVSNFTVDQMKEASDVSNDEIVCNQVEYHPYLSQKPVLDFVRQNNMFLTAYSPIARGGVVEDAAIKEIGLKHGKNPVQVTLRWLIQQERVAAIPKAASENHMKSNFEIFDFELSQEEMDKVSALAKPDGRMTDPDWAPQWDQAA